MAKKIDRHARKMMLLTMTMYMVKKYEDFLPSFEPTGVCLGFLNGKVFGLDDFKALMGGK
jgi:hypothetical protein